MYHMKVGVKGYLKMKKTFESIFIIFFMYVNAFIWFKWNEKKINSVFMSIFRNQFLICEKAGPMTINLS